MITRSKIVDPSWFNWPALPVAMANTIVPDFPLTNKSFNQSYAGNDSDQSARLYPSPASANRPSAVRVIEAVGEQRVQRPVALRGYRSATPRPAGPG